jgi:hypothetical protein
MSSFGCAGNLLTDLTEDFYLVITVGMLRLAGDWQNETELNNGEVEQNTF